MNSGRRQSLTMAFAVLAARSAAGLTCRPASWASPSYLGPRDSPARPGPAPLKPGAAVSRCELPRRRHRTSEHRTSNIEYRTSNITAIPPPSRILQRKRRPFQRQRHFSPTSSHRNRGAHSQPGIALAPLALSHTKPPAVAGITRLVAVAATAAAASSARSSAGAHPTAGSRHVAARATGVLGLPDRP